MRTLDTAILIGSFEPLHVGHLTALDSALEAAERVLLLIGSARAARSIRHPWAAGEREEMIRSSVPAAQLGRIDIRSIPDDLYRRARWLAEVQQAAADASAPGQRVGIVAGPAGADWSRSFPQWHRLAIGQVGTTSAADLRQRYLAGTAPGPDLPEGARAVLERLRQGPDFAGLEAEYRAVQAHSQAWSVAPYPPVLVTVDAVVLQSGHILLIRRGRQPGQGLWALPGGFVDPHETLLAGCLRELREETGLALPDATLLANLREQHVFDHPERSLRGRTITHGFFFELSEGELPRVAGSDDAERAEWVPLARFLDLQEQMFEDHYHIVRLFIG
jgi:bifunctional NMN adenylyltransferase/nudix hydrolase